MANHHPMVSSRLVVGLGLLASSLANPCTKKDVAPDPSGESATWSLAGCTSLDLSCPPMDAAAEASPCNNSLAKGDIDSLALALGESSGTLNSIELRGNWLGPHGANLLSKALAGHASLTSLGLASCRAGDYGIMALVKVLLTSAPPQLERVDLSHNSVGDVGARELSTLLEADALPKLIEADLSWNGIGPRGGRYLGTALARNTGLQSLKLDWNGLMDRGARAIGEGLATNSGLQTLSLEHNAIKNEGGRALAQGLRTNGALKVRALHTPWDIRWTGLTHCYRTPHTWHLTTPQSAGAAARLERHLARGAAGGRHRYRVDA